VKSLSKYNSSIIVGISWGFFPFFILHDSLKSLLIAFFAIIQTKVDTTGVLFIKGFCGNFFKMILISKIPFLF
jgi:hypothetical protein